jgi:hypothetical protein
MLPIWSGESWKAVQKKVATGDGILLLLGVTPDVLASSVATGCQIFLAMNY